MEKLQTKILKTISMAANSMAEKESREWPPGCIFLSYQPVRPCSEKESKVHTKEK